MFAFKAGAALAIGLLATASQAADYKPVTCPAAKPYIGPALHDAVALPATQPITDAPFDASTTAALVRALTTAQSATRAPAITATVAVPGRGLWTSASGTDAPLFYWASAGKTMTAVVILQLADEGRLSLDDKISKWVKGVPNGDAITVRDLLAHTSGLFSANEDVKWHDEHRAHSFDEALKVLNRHGAMFCPGERWRYSNTGYDLLGEIISQVDGRPYPDAITARIIKPLGLAHMRVVRSGEANADTAPLSSAQDKPMDIAWPGPAGPIVASAPDMVRFWSALLAGRVVKPATTQALFSQLYPMFDAGTFYGLGVMTFDVPEVDGHQTLWLGHAGGMPGANALVIYSPDDKAFIAVAMTGDGSATATANLLLRQLRTQ